MVISRFSPNLIEGEISVDDRGSLTYCNDFDMTAIRRFYQVSNHTLGLVRAWHGHRYEEKYLFVSQGVAIIAAVRVDDWSNPNPDADINKYVLSSVKPTILYIPAGYAHGFKTLTLDTKIEFFSTATLAESSADDYRIDPYFWNPWDIIER